MELFRNKRALAITILVLLACCTHESEGLRRVLRGRRTMTRQYYYGIGFPAWVVIVLVAIGEILIGVILYFALRYFILRDDEEGTQMTTMNKGVTYHKATDDDHPSSAATTSAFVNPYPATLTSQGQTYQRTPQLEHMMEDEV